LIHRRNLTLILGFILFLVLLAGTSVFGVENPIVVKNIEFVNADLRDVFRSLAQAGNFNVIIEPTVQGEVALTLKYGVTLKDAVSLIAKTYGYSCRWLADSPTAVIGSAKFIKLNFDHKIPKVFQLNFADPAVIAEALEVVIPRNRIKVDPNAKQVTVVANELELENIMEIIAEWDRELPEINVETKLLEVSNQFWKDIGIVNTFLAPHMGVYLLNAQQVKVTNENPKTNLLSSSVVKGLNNHQVRNFFGDKVPLITEKNKQGKIDYKVEYINAGTSVTITPKLNSEKKLTIKIKIAVSTIANKGKSGKNWIPWVVTREFESTIRLEAGQAFLLSGLLQRGEYNMMKEGPYDFLALSKLFNKENPILKNFSNSQTEVVLILMPKLSDTQSGADVAGSNVAVQNQATSEGKAVTTGTTASPDQTVVGIKEKTDHAPDELYDKLPIDEDKPIVNITATADDTPPDMQNTVADKFIEIKYQVKKGDSLIGIVNKFGSDLKLVAEKNKLEKAGAIKTDTILIIPVPSGRCYILKVKETLWRIAKRYGTTMAVLKDLNGIADETKVKAGQIIVLPVPVTQIVNPQF
jgi:LysM repeat protein